MYMAGIRISNLKQRNAENAIKIYSKSFLSFILLLPSIYIFPTYHAANAVADFFGAVHQNIQQSIIHAFRNVASHKAPGTPTQLFVR